jgi:hypothetical protein
MTTPSQLSEAAVKDSRKNVDRSIRTLMQEMEHENTLLQESPGSRLQKVLKIYRGIKPLLAVLSSLPLIPSTWRAAIVMLTQALEALAITGADPAVDFKAGKDL